MQIEALNQNSSPIIDAEKSSKPAALSNNHHSEDDDNYNNRVHEENALLENF